MFGMSLGCSGREEVEVHANCTQGEPEQQVPSTAALLQQESSLKTAVIGFAERAPGATKLKSGQQKFSLPSVHGQQGLEFWSHEQLGDLGRKKQSHQCPQMMCITQNPKRT